MRLELQTTDNLAALLKYVEPHASRLADVLGGLSSTPVIATAIRDAAIRCLERQFPKAKLSASTLVRYYPEDAMALLNQNYCRAVDWVQAHPPSDRDDNVEGLVSFLAVPYSQRGQPAHGRAHKSLYEIKYNHALEALSRRRKDSFNRGELEDLFGTLAEDDYDRLRVLTRSRIACEYASRMIKPHLRPESIRSLLSPLRCAADRFDKDLAR